MVQFHISLAICQILLAQKNSSKVISFNLDCAERPNLVIRICDLWKWKRVVSLTVWSFVIGCIQFSGKFSLWSVLSYTLISLIFCHTLVGALFYAFSFLCWSWDSVGIIWVAVWLARNSGSIPRAVVPLNSILTSENLVFWSHCHRLNESLQK